MGLGDTIEFPHVALCLMPEILDAIDVVVTVRKERGGRKISDQLLRWID